MIIMQTVFKQQLGRGVVQSGQKFEFPGHKMTSATLMNLN